VSGIGSAGREKDPGMGTLLVGEAEREEMGDSLDMLMEKADMGCEIRFGRQRPFLLYLCPRGSFSGSP
jgi:hypothetical protein